MNKVAQAPTPARLKACRVARKMSLKAVERKTGIQSKTLYSYEKSHCDISGHALRLLAPLYETTSDYLLGISDSY